MVGVADAFTQEWIREPLRYLLAVSGVAILVVGLQRGHAGPVAAGLLAGAQPADPVADRLSAPAALDAGRGDRDRHAARAHAAAARRPGLPGRHQRVRRHAGVLDRRRGRDPRCAGRSPAATARSRWPSTSGVAGGELPLPAVAAAAMSFAALLSLLIYHGASRWYGIGWMVFGVALYVYYRKSEDKPVFKRVTVPEKSLTRTRPDAAEYGSILVPVKGRPLDDDIVQTAGRLAAEENEDLGEGGARDRGAVGVRGAAVAPARRADPRGGAQAGAQGARARQGGGGGVRGRRGRHRGGARAPRGRGDRARGQAPRGGGDRAGRRGEGADPRRHGAGRQGRDARHVRGRDHPPRRQQGALPRDPHRRAAAGCAPAAVARRRAAAHRGRSRAARRRRTAGAPSR